MFSCRAQQSVTLAIRNMQCEVLHQIFILDIILEMKVQTNNFYNLGKWLLLFVIFNKEGGIFTLPLIWHYILSTREACQN